MVEQSHQLFPKGSAERMEPFRVKFFQSVQAGVWFPIHQTKQVVGVLDSAKVTICPQSASFGE